MNLEAFEREREPDWEQLERRLARLRRPGRPAPDDLLALGRGYRAVVADLALVQREYPGDPIAARLRRDVLAGRQAIYGARTRRHGSLRRFAVRGYWQLITGRPGPLALALAATFVPCLLAAAWGLHDPGAALGLVPAEFRRAAHPHVYKLTEHATTLAAVSSSIFINNIQVAFLAFAGGLVLGLGTIAVLAYNGALLGAIAGITIQSGNFSVLIRYIAPHGVLELSCFAVAGAAGLRLASALVDPGAQSRAQALRAAARPAVTQVLGTAFWLVCAGLTEGFVTPRGLPLGWALAIGLAWGTLFWGMVVWRGALPAASARLRRGRERDSDHVRPRVLSRR